MSLTIVDHAGCSSYGILVRAYVAKGVPDLNKFLAFKKHGGKRKTMRLALWHEAQLKAKARTLRRVQ